MSVFIGKVDPFIGRPDMLPTGDLEEKSRHAVLVTAFFISKLLARKKFRTAPTHLRAKFNVQFRA
jgi:hypothetical protein